jgi:hypothetical protein
MREGCAARIAAPRASADSGVLLRCQCAQGLRRLLRLAPHPDPQRLPLDEGRGTSGRDGHCCADPICHMIDDGVCVNYRLFYGGNRVILPKCMRVNVEFQALPMFSSESAIGKKMRHWAAWCELG